MPDKVFEVQTTQQISAIENGEIIQLVLVGGGESIELRFKTAQFESTLARMVDIFRAAKRAKQSKTE